MIFKQMAERIVLQIKELKEADAHRREFLANITHDLRTPLTSLQGYLETLLMKEGALTPEEQRNYLTIAMKRSDQLGKLVYASSLNWQNWIHPMSRSASNPFPWRNSSRTSCRSSSSLLRRKRSRSG